MIGPTIENVRRRQSESGHLFSKVFRFRFAHATSLSGRQSFYK
jgi:hypothetical protein